MPTSVGAGGGATGAGSAGGELAIEFVGERPRVPKSDVVAKKSGQGGEEKKDTEAEAGAGGRSVVSPGNGADEEEAESAEEKALRESETAIFNFCLHQLSAQDEDVKTLLEELAKCSREAEKPANMDRVKRNIKIKEVFKKNRWDEKKRKHPDFVELIKKHLAACAAARRRDSEAAAADETSVTPGDAELASGAPKGDGEDKKPQIKLTFEIAPVTTQARSDASSAGEESRPAATPPATESAPTEGPAGETPETAPAEAAGAEAPAQAAGAVPLSTSSAPVARQQHEAKHCDSAELALLPRAEPKHSNPADPALELRADKKRQRGRKMNSRQKEETLLRDPAVPTPRSGDALIVF